MAVQRFLDGSYVMDSLTGILVPGVKFAQTPQADKNTLDFFDKAGAFTPTLTFGGAAVDLTYAAQAASYVRIANLIIFDLVLVLSAKGSSTGAALIESLPFAAHGSNNFYCGITLQSFAAGVGDTHVNGSVMMGTTTMKLLKYSGGSQVQLTDADFGNNSNIRAQGFYRV